MVRPRMDGDTDNQSPWSAWYEDHGSLLFAIASAAGVSSDYVLNVTGWRWLQGGISTHDGTSGNDLLDFGTTYYQPPANGGGIPPPLSTIDQLLFGYEGNDELRGNAGVDRLVGGPGDDLLRGGSDSDMYVYATGDGLDKITDDSGTADTIYFSSELNSANLNVSRISGTNDLLLYFGSQPAGIILTNQWTSAAGAIENVHFVGEDGLDAGDISSIYLASLASSGNNSVTGSWASERLVGLDGNNSLSGADGNDQLDGGNGGDTLNGGNGNDVLFGSAGTIRFGATGITTVIEGAGDERTWDLGGSIPTSTLSAMATTSSMTP